MIRYVSRGASSVPLISVTTSLTCTTLLHTPLPPVCYHLNSTGRAGSNTVVQQLHTPSSFPSTVGRRPIIETSPSVTERPIHVTGCTKYPVGSVLAITGHKLRVGHVSASVTSDSRGRCIRRTPQCVSISAQHGRTAPKGRQPRPPVPVQRITTRPKHLLDLQPTVNGRSLSSVPGTTPAAGIPEDRSLTPDMTPRRHSVGTLSLTDGDHARTATASQYARAKH